MLPGSSSSCYMGRGFLGTLADCTFLEILEIRIVTHDVRFADLKTFAIGCPSLNVFIAEARVDLSVLNVLKRFCTPLEKVEVITDLSHGEHASERRASEE